MGGIQMVGGNPQVTFAGIPGFTYHVQRTDSLITPNWTTIGSAVTADAQGHIIFTDTNPLPGQASSTGRSSRKPNIQVQPKSKL